MRLGLFDVIPASSLEGLTAEDLRLLLNGVGDINVQTLISYTSFNDESGKITAFFASPLTPPHPHQHPLCCLNSKSGEVTASGLLRPPLLLRLVVFIKDRNGKKSPSFPLDFPQQDPKHTRD